MTSHDAVYMRVPVMTLFDGQPLAQSEIPSRCDCGHTLTAHAPDGDECSECPCQFFTELEDSWAYQEDW